MSERFRWADARERLRALTPAERRTLLVLSRLPLLWTEALNKIGQLGAEGTAYAVVGRLRAAGLVASLQASFRPGRSPALLHLTDQGLAVATLDRGADPVQIARRNGLRASDMLAELPGLPQLVACYEMLAALCESRPGHITALAWERPWRRRYHRPTAKAPLSVALPAGVELWWEDRREAYLLLPDLGASPLRAYRRAIARLMELGAFQGGSLPTMVIAADASRATAWRWLLQEVGRSRRALPVKACVATWGSLEEELALLLSHPAKDNADARRYPGLGHSLPYEPRRPTSPIPRPIGTMLGASPVEGRAAVRVSPVALGLSPEDRRLLDLVGRHPFLSAAGLAGVLGWMPGWALRRRNRLIVLGLVRLLGRSEVGETTAALRLAELTAEGLAIVAAQQGLSLPAAIRHNGLAGGGPQCPSGARRSLLQNLAHTLGVNALFVGLYRLARLLASSGEHDAVVEWRSAAACARRHVRPDGYGIYRRQGQLCGFFLEYDRGTMADRDLLKKFAAYHDYLASGAYEADYVGFPTILVVAKDSRGEKRIARVASAAATGRAPLPVLLTCEWRIIDPRSPLGLLGAIWRAPDGAYDHRRAWPLGLAKTERMAGKWL
ncbi:MAG: replication-relaxation family protein [Chloroflexota bacterium]